MKGRVTTLHLEAGDVSAIRVFRNRRGIRLLVYDQRNGLGVPLIEALLAEGDVMRLREALGEPRESQARRKDQLLDGITSLRSEHESRRTRKAVSGRPR
jgi:hypothetical protein